MSDMHPTSCTHCGQSVPTAMREGRDAASPVFCCVGCEAVWFALQDAGFEEFYAWREASGSAGVTPPEDPVQRRAGYLDALARKAVEQSDGTKSLVLMLEGVHCAGCVWLIERMARSLAGVQASRLDLSRSTLALRWDPNTTNLDAVAHWLRGFGYVIQGVGGENEGSEDRALLIRMGISWAIAGNVMLIAFAFYSGLSPQSEGLGQAGAWVGLALSCVSLIVGGSVFAKRAWMSLRSLFDRDGGGIQSLSMDVPIVVGIGVGWLYSAYSVVVGRGDVWLDSICVLIAALLTARYLHIRGHRRAREAVGRGVEVLPDIAHRIASSGELEEVEARTLARGDRVLVRSGDVVPADGLILHGSSKVNRAMLTGESDPERVTIGDRIEAGALNEGAPLEVQVEAVGEESRMGGVAKWVMDRDASRGRTYAGIGADQWGGLFVSAILLLALIVCVLWTWIANPSVGVDRAVALLVVACPCALSMAAPLAFSVTIGQAAERGIYIKHSVILESLRDVTTVVLDKTGTLTEGVLSVERVLGNTQTLQRACALEVQSQHPSAQALVRWGRKQGLKNAHNTIDLREEVAGAGIWGTVNGEVVHVGRVDWIRSILHDPSSLDSLRNEHRDPQLSWVAVALEYGRAGVALAGLSDTLCADSRSTVHALQSLGIRPQILSGDAHDAVQTVARSLSIPESAARAGVTPEEKEETIRALQERGEVVLMLGDGINDAAALQQADIGCAVGESASISQVAADAFIVRGGLRPVLDLVHAAKQTRLRTKYCLSIGLAYNISAVLLASCGVMSPLVAAFSMPISSLAVVLVAVTLRAFPSSQHATVRAPQPSPLRSLHATLSNSAAYPMHKDS